MVRGVFLGYYDNQEKAHLVYKKAKEDYVREVAENYKSVIDGRLYQALLMWEIKELEATIELAQKQLQEYKEMK